MCDSMVKICMNCWDIPCSCGKHIEVGIDELIFDDILKLNKKGYLTVFCCQGHKEFKVFDLYVMLSEKYLGEVPKPLKVDRNKKCIRFCKWSDKIKDSEIEYARKSFSEWVESLPSKVI